jgi:hypothetical protein
MAQGIRVVMTDTFMSGWGPATGKQNIYCVECDTYEQAQLILKNAKKRSEMKRARIVTTGRKYYNPETHLLTLKHFNELSGPWKE